MWGPYFRSEPCSCEAVCIPLLVCNAQHMFFCLRGIILLLVSFLSRLLTACCVAVLQPLETMSGLLTQPGFTGKQPLHQEALAKVCRLPAWRAQETWLPTQYAAWMMLAGSVRAVTS
jgi:hypothetical protein